MSRWRPSNNQSALYCIPDLNGNVQLLNKILNRILPLRKSDGIKDRLILLGDSIDRNIQSCQVLDKLISIKKDQPDQVIFLRGNHEQLFLQSMNKDPLKNLSLQDQFNAHQCWMYNGGNATLQGYLDRAKIEAKPFRFSAIQNC